MIVTSFPETDGAYHSTSREPAFGDVSGNRYCERGVCGHIITIFFSEYTFDHSPGSSVCSGILNLPEPSNKFTDITYEQDEVSNCSCTLHGALGALSDLLGTKFSLEDRKALWERALALGAQEGLGWYVDKAVKLIRDFAREKGHDILYFRVMLGSEEYEDAIKKGYSVVTGFRGNASYNQDISDGVLDGINFTDLTYGHCLRLTEMVVNPINESVVDNYPLSRPKSNIYRVNDLKLKDLRANGVFFNSGYVFANRKDFETINVPDYAKTACKKAKEKGIITKSFNEPVTAYRLAVILDNLKLLEKN